MAEKTAQRKGKESRLSQDWCKGRQVNKSEKCVGQGESTEKEEGVRAAGTLKKPKHGRAVVIGLDHPSGLAERLVVVCSLDWMHG